MHLSHLLAIPLAAQLVAAVPRHNILKSRQSGPSTRDDPRPQLGNIPYGGVGVRTCTVPGTVALTYDDGPNIYTADLLDQLASYGFKATFFVCGNNGRGALDGDSRWINLVKRMDAEGHQVAGHTWDHENLTDIPIAAKVDTMVKTEMAIRNILGKYPTYMRPPYATCEGSCPATMKMLGYVVAYYDIETNDWQGDYEQSKANFKNVMDSTPKSAGRIALAHDIHEQTVTNLTPYMLQYLRANGWKGVTLGECLGDPKANWYRTNDGTSTPSSSTSAPPTPTPSSGTAPISANGLCGVQGGETCAGSVWGSCCSQYGYCGSGDAWCGAGCNPAFGTCNGLSTSSSVPASSSVRSSSSIAQSSSIRPSSSSVRPSSSSVRPSSSSVRPSTASSVAPSPTPSGKTSTDGSCGGTNGFTCIGFAEGECCSQYGWCGNSAAHCGTLCNPAFGKCNSSPQPTSTRTTSTARTSSSTRTTSTLTPQPTQKVSVDATCGGTNKYTCQGSSFGNCCSSAGWCGSTAAYCGSGCQKGFGTCN